MKKEKFDQTGGLTYFYMDEIQSKPYGFDDPMFYPTPQFETWECSVCGYPVLNNISQRGMKRRKCDSCKKDLDNLINTIRFWEKKVGIKVAS